MKNKKGQGLSMNVVIIAALGLLVLVILAVIFTGKAADFRKTADSCQANKGACVEKGACKGDYQTVINSVCYESDGKTPDATKECCVST